MTKIIILKNTVANKKLVGVGEIIEVEPDDAKFLVYIKKAKYFDSSSIPVTSKTMKTTDENIKKEMGKDSLIENLTPVKKKRGRPFKNGKYS